MDYLNIKLKFYRLKLKYFLVKNPNSLIIWINAQSFLRKNFLYASIIRIKIE